MTALALSVGVFAVWWLIGLAVLAAIGADTSPLRVVLTAPVLGTATTLIPLFVVNYAGAPLEDGAIPVLVLLVAAAAVVLIRRRPRVPVAVAPVVAVCIAGFVIVGRPLLEFGFNWLGNANDDMATYVLSATAILHHGLLGPVNAADLAQDRHYWTALQTLHNQGERPGGEITLAALSSVTGRPPYQLFMPLILALGMCTVSGAAALAMQSARRNWAAAVAAVLLVASPLETYGILQQLLPQIWGLGLATALAALLMREDIHRGQGPSIRDLVPITMLAVALIVVYVEFASTIGLAYGLYVTLLIAKRRVTVRALVRLWGTALAAVVLILNVYLLKELDWLRFQTTSGVKAARGGALFAYALVPDALAAVVGLQLLPPSQPFHHLEESILLAAVLLGLAVFACIVSAARGGAAAVVLVVDLVLGVFLGVRDAGFGLFKLYMYVQPFLAAAVAAWFAGLARRYALVLGAAILVLLSGEALRNTDIWIDRSRNPVDLRDASSPRLMPVFLHALAVAQAPVVSVTDNPVLAKLEASGAGNRPLHFVSRNFFAGSVDWTHRSFALFPSSTGLKDTFEDNPLAAAVLSTGRCLLVLPTGSQQILNRRSLPEGSPDLVERPCTGAKNTLVFTVSSLGQPYYLPTDHGGISFFQLVPDYFYPGSTVSAFGRYALFRVLNPSSGVRLALSLTTTYLSHEGTSELPPATAIGVSREAFPLVGSGSARAFSPVLKPQMIGGQPFVLVDMGENGRRPSEHRSGVAGLFGPSSTIYPRYVVTTDVRDISLVSDAQYRTLRAPAALSRFPADLADPGLEYSGIYEDGWLSTSSYFGLAGGGAGQLIVRADVLPSEGQHLEVLVDGRVVVSRAVSPGPLDLKVELRASSTRRRVELRWARSTRLAAPDLRPAVALLRFIGVTPAG